jgi:hypothetical protein
MAYAVKGNARQAKFAARLLAYSTQADTLTVSLAKVGSCPHARACSSI